MHGEGGIERKGIRMAALGAQCGGGVVRQGCETCTQRGGARGGVRTDKLVDISEDHEGGRSDQLLHSEARVRDGEAVEAADDAEQPMHRSQSAEGVAPLGGLAVRDEKEGAGQQAEEVVEQHHSWLADVHGILRVRLADVLSGGLDAVRWLASAVEAGSWP